MILNFPLNCVIWCMCFRSSLQYSFIGSVKVLHNIPHDEESFTQGLFLHNGNIYESSGLYRKSSIRIINPITGKIVKSVRVSDDLFAEGITIFNDIIYMLTWKETVLLMYNATTLEVIGRRQYPGQGWGVTHDNTSLLVSDGSHLITVYELPVLGGKGQLKQTRQISVRDASTNQLIRNLNELEYVNNHIFANVWYADVILKIDPRTGYVVRKYDCRSLYPYSRRTRRADSFNGIAYNASDDSFLVTGKLWPKYYRLRLDEDMAGEEEFVPGIFPERTGLTGRTHGRDRSSKGMKSHHRNANSRGSLRN